MSRSIKQDALNFLLGDGNTRYAYELGRLLEALEGDVFSRWKAGGIDDSELRGECRAYDRLRKLLARPPLEYDEKENIFVDKPKG